MGDIVRPQRTHHTLNTACRVGTARTGRYVGTMPTPLPFLTVVEAAQRLRVSRMTILRLISAGELPAYRIGRQFRLEPGAVDAYLTRQRVSA